MRIGLLAQALPRRILISSLIIYIMLGRVNSSFAFKIEYLPLLVEKGSDVSPGILLVGFLKKHQCYT
jgi:hypothetical protein